MKLIYITIGNSDNRLGQARWSNFCFSLEQVVGRLADRVFFVGYSLPNSTYQNMCASFHIKDDDVLALRSVLRGLAMDYEQECIALCVSDGAELVEP
jgi:hypothetical protein